MNDAEIMAALAEPFAADRVGWKPQTVAKDGNRAMAICYIDARDVMDRLDAVVGVSNWQTRFDVLADGNAVCHLSLRLNGEWVCKSDVGGESDQKDDGDRRKASFSDALKRAAVQWGVGRYLYRLDAVWCDYDAAKKQLKGTPQLPAWATPKAKATNGTPQAQAQPMPGDQFAARCLAFDARALAAGVIPDAGVLCRQLVDCAREEKGYGPDLAGWPAESHKWAESKLREFWAAREKAQKAQNELAQRVRT